MEKTLEMSSIKTYTWFCERILEENDENPKKEKNQILKCICHLFVVFLHKIHKYNTFYLFKLKIFALIFLT